VWNALDKLDKLGSFFVGSPDNRPFKISLKRASRSFLVLAFPALLLTWLESSINPMLASVVTWVIGVVSLVFLAAVCLRIGRRWSDEFRDFIEAHKEAQKVRVALIQAHEERRQAEARLEQARLELVQARLELQEETQKLSHVEQRRSAVLQSSGML
jgi:hypothetical protein